MKKFFGAVFKLIVLAAIIIVGINLFVVLSGGR